MINHLYIKYYRWNTETGVRSDIYGGDTWDIDLAIDGLIGVANTNIVVEGDGDSILASDTGVSLSNRISDLGGLPAIFGTTIGGDIENHTWGIFGPLLDSSGVEVVIAECLIMGKFGNVTRLAPVGSLMQTGEIDTYAEFIELITDADGVDEDSVVIMPGYLELKTQSNSKYSNEVTFGIINLSKLLSIVKAKALDLTPMLSTTDLLDQIITNLPFVTATDVETLPFGTVNLPVPLAIEEDIDVAHGITDSKFDNFTLFPEENAKITVWQYEGGQEYYVFLQNPLDDATDIRAVKINIDVAGGVTLNWLSEGHPDLDKFNQNDPEWYSDFDFRSSYVRPANSANYADMMSSLAPFDEGFAKHPYITVDIIDNVAGSVFCNDTKNILNEDSPSYAGEPVTQYETFSISQNWSFRVGWDFSNSKYNRTFERLNGTYSGNVSNSFVIWRKNFRKFFIISPDKKRLLVTPTPEHGSKFANIGWNPFEYTKKTKLDNVTRPPAVGSGTVNVYRHVLKDTTIYTVAPNLGSGDLGFPKIYIGDLRETHYTKYPVYYKDDDDNSFILLFAKKIGINGYDCDGGDIKWGERVSTAYPDGFMSNDNLYFREFIFYEEKFTLPNDIPKDLPVNPIFRYDARDRLEIWYYSDSKKALLCYDWQMNLKYGYKLNVPFENVALGRDKDGKLLITLTTDKYFVFATHKPSGEIYYTNFDVEETSIESVVRNLSKWNFATYWIDRKDSANTLFFRNRYSGEIREGVNYEARTDMNESYPTDGENNPPNRVFTREAYDKFADKITVNSFLGECGTAGLDNSLYTFKYDLGDIFNRELGGRIAQKLYQVLAKRREKLYLPMQAFRCNNYDKIKPFSGDDTEYSVIAQRSDFYRELKTDVEAFELEDIYLIDEDLQCILSSIFWNPSGWQYSTANLLGPCSTSFCGDCEDNFDTFMLGLMGFLDAEWILSVTDYPSGLNIDTDELITEMITFLYEHLFELFVSNRGLTITLNEALTDYMTCKALRCP